MVIEPGGGEQERWRTVRELLSVFVQQCRSVTLNKLGGNPSYAANVCVKQSFAGLRVRVYMSNVELHYSRIWSIAGALDPMRLLKSLDGSESVVRCMLEAALWVRVLHTTGSHETAGTNEGMGKRSVVRGGICSEAWSSGTRSYVLLTHLLSLCCVVPAEARSVLAD
nr:hypothetical protein CFP56_03989 [Quercus suber]